MMSARETEPAKITHASVGFEDHDMFTLRATFDFGGSGQGLTHGINQDYIERFIRACGVRWLHECKGRIVLVTHDWTSITKVAPMKFEPGEPFDIEQWGTVVRGFADMGAAAYDAYCSEMKDWGDSLPVWSALSSHEKVAWRHAAAIVRGPER